MDPEVERNRFKKSHSRRRGRDRGNRSRRIGSRREECVSDRLNRTLTDTASHSRSRLRRDASPGGDGVDGDDPGTRKERRMSYQEVENPEREATHD
jgi:hypothetical protein